MSDLISREAQDVKHIKALTRIKENYERLWRENLAKEEDVKEEYDAVCAGITALEAEPCEDCISRQAVNKLVDELARAISDEKCHIQRGRNYGRIMHDILELPSVEPEQKDRECASCKHSNNGECAYTEECHECMWESQYERKVEPERKPGHWEWDQRAGEYVCSECGCNPIYERTTPDVSEIDKYRFCRWCGAPMEVNG